MMSVVMFERGEMGVSLVKDRRTRLRVKILLSDLSRNLPGGIVRARFPSLQRFVKCTKSRPINANNFTVPSRLANMPITVSVSFHGWPTRSLLRRWLMISVEATYNYVYTPPALREKKSTPPALRFKNMHAHSRYKSNSSCK